VGQSTISWKGVAIYHASFSVATPPRLPAIRQGETRNEKGETRNEKPDMRNEKPEARNEMGEAGGKIEKNADYADKNYYRLMHTLSA